MFTPQGGYIPSDLSTPDVPPWKVSSPTPRADMVLFFASPLRLFLNALCSRSTILSENTVLKKEN